MTDDELIAIKERAEKWLLQIPGVHAVAVGVKIVSGELTPQLAIGVFVVKKRPLDELKPDERIPAEIEGVPTDVIEEPVPQLALGGTTPTADEAEYSVLRGGIQISAGSGNGTLGFIARTTLNYARGPHHFVLAKQDHLVGDPDA